MSDLPLVLTLGPEPTETRWDLRGGELWPGCVLYVYRTGEMVAVEEVDGNVVTVRRALDGNPPALVCHGDFMFLTGFLTPWAKRVAESGLHPAWIAR